MDPNNQWNNQQQPQQQNYQQPQDFQQQQNFQPPPQNFQQQPPQNFQQPPPQNMQYNNFQQPGNFQQPNQWNQGPPPPPEDPKAKNFAVIGLLAAIAGIALWWVPLYLPIWLEIFAPLIVSSGGIIFAIMAMQKIPNGSPSRGIAVAALIIAIISVTLSALCTACFASILCAFEGAVDDINNIFSLL